MPENVEILNLIAAFAGGVLLGASYFGGLWWTVRRLPQAKRPMTLYFGSLAIRLAGLMLAFYGVLTFYEWPHLAAALMGLIFARTALVRFFGPSKMTDSSAPKVSP